MKQDIGGIMDEVLASKQKANHDESGQKLDRIEANREESGQKIDRVEANQEESAQKLDRILGLALKLDRIKLDRIEDTSLHPAVKLAKRQLKGSAIYEELEEQDEVLGSGSFGVVKAGTYYGRPVAIKQALDSLYGPQDRENFRREASTHHSLKHDRIVRVIAFSPGDDSHAPCLVMERMECTLRHFLGVESAEPDLPGKLAYIIDICEGLRYLHHLNVIHRDINSNNVLLDGQGAKVSDFGLAHVCSTLRSTGDGSFPYEKAMGTNFWMAPEVHDRKESSFDSDIFSLHVVMWEIIEHSQGGRRGHPAIGSELLSYPHRKLELKGEDDEGDTPKRRLHKLVRRCGLLDRRERPKIRDALAETKLIYDSLSESGKGGACGTVTASAPLENPTGSGSLPLSEVRRRNQEENGASEGKEGPWEDWKDFDRSLVEVEPTGEAARGERAGGGAGGNGFRTKPSKEETEDIYVYLMAPKLAAAEEAAPAATPPGPSEVPAKDQQGRANKQQDEVAELIFPSEAPADRRMSAISRVRSMSAKNLLDVESPVPRHTTPSSSERFEDYKEETEDIYAYLMAPKLAAAEEAAPAVTPPGPSEVPAKDQQGRANKQQDEVAELIFPSEAPADRRMSAISRVRSMSAKNLLDVESPVPRHTTPSSSERFEELMKDNYKEGYLMWQRTMLEPWIPAYFVLENGYLSRYDKKSLVGTETQKTIELKADTRASCTNYKNVFGVRTGATNCLFLLARNEQGMNDWFGAITAQVHALFMREHNISGDDYRNEGLKGRFFFRMVDDSLPQWIRTYPEEAAPRTGDGLFPGEVIEVEQVLTNKEEKVFLRIANDRGWTYANNSADDSTLFEEISGDFAEDKRNYGFPPTANEPIPILFGPGLESQQTGEALIPGERAEAMERFTPADGSGVVFIKLSDGRGWVPVGTNISFGVTPTDH